MNDHLLAATSGEEYDMGADLITFICKGPATLDASRKDAAVTKGREILDAIEEWHNEEEKNDGPDEDKMKLILAKLPTEFSGKEFHEVRFLHGLSALKVFEDLLAVWNGDSRCRDKNARPDPDDTTQRIVVVGELSSGDEPDGWGYQT